MIPEQTGLILRPANIPPIRGRFAIVVLVVMSGLLVGCNQEKLQELRSGAMERITRYRIESTARKYLTALESSDYVKAYTMLSEPAKQYVSQEDFTRRQGSDNRSWSHRNIHLLGINEDVALIGFDLKIGTEPREQVTQFWTRQEGRWYRAYNLNLNEKVDAAQNVNDSTATISAAQALLAVNQKDPNAYRGLCWAYVWGRSADALEACAAADQYDKAFPGYLKPESIFYIHYNWGTALYKLDKYGEAEKEFSRALEIFDRASIPTPSLKAETLFSRSVTISDSSVQYVKNAKGFSDRGQVAVEVDNKDEGLLLLNRVKENDQKAVDADVRAMSDLDMAAEICNKNESRCDEKLQRDIHKETLYLQKRVAQMKRLLTRVDAFMQQTKAGSSVADQRAIPPQPRKSRPKKFRLKGYAPVSIEDLIADPNAYYGRTASVSVRGWVSKWGININTLGTFLLNSSDETGSPDISVNAQYLSVAARRELLKMRTSGGAWVTVAGVWDGRELVGRLLHSERQTGDTVDSE